MIGISLNSAFRAVFDSSCRLRPANEMKVSIFEEQLALRQELMGVQD